MHLHTSASRRAVAGFLHHSGALAATRALTRSYHLSRHTLRLKKNTQPRFIILCYHRVGTGGIPFYSELPTWKFEQQMHHIRRNYRLCSLDDLVEQLEEPKDSTPAVAVTFDDGYHGTYTEAFPILREYAIPATVYLAAGCIESGEVAWYDRLFLALQSIPSPHLDVAVAGRRFDLTTKESRIDATAQIVGHLRRIPQEERIRACAEIEAKTKLPQCELKNRMMSWAQIREMQACGVKFEAHTMTHPVLSRLNSKAQENEIRESKCLIENRLGREVLHFAYPFGKPEDFTEETTAILRRLNFRSAATTVWGVNDPGVLRFGLRRVQIGEDTSLANFAFNLALLALQEPTTSDAPAAQMPENCAT